MTMNTASLYGFSCASDEKRTSDRSFGAAALSIGPADPMAEAIPPVL